MKKIIDFIRWIIQNFPVIKQVFDLIFQIVDLIKDLFDDIRKKPQVGK